MLIENSNKRAKVGTLIRSSYYACNFKLVKIFVLQIQVHIAATVTHEPRIANKGIWTAIDVLSI